MSATLAIAGRELASYFRSSVGWVVLALYLLLSGVWIALGTLRPGEPATLRGFFAVSQWLLLIVAPAVSMRLIAEEARSGTFESLRTAPVSDWQVVFGKYLGALGFLLCMLAPTLAYAGILEAVADPDYGPIGAGYLAVALVGMLYLAVGLFTSALTENQVVSLIATLFFFLLLEIATTQGGRLLGPPWDGPLFAFSVLLRVSDMAKGVIDTAHVAFFMLFSLWFLVLSVVVLEFRRWR
ncbi:MAG TPA: ABC transporter [Phycisphaerales bacterium]|nr:ABC transporter [Phycisphaerales bacterium]